MTQLHIPEVRDYNGMLSRHNKVKGGPSGYHAVHLLFIGAHSRCGYWPWFWGAKERVAHSWSSQFVLVWTCTRSEKNIIFLWRLDTWEIGKSEKKFQKCIRSEKFSTLTVNESRTCWSQPRRPNLIHVYWELQSFYSILQFQLILIFSYNIYFLFVVQVINNVESLERLTDYGKWPSNKKNPDWWEWLSQKHDDVQTSRKWRLNSLTQLMIVKYL